MISSDALSPDQATGARRRGRPRDAAADGRILEAATELILERGFEATTVDEVAVRAKVGKATVYRRWARKEDLALAAMEMLYSQEMVVPDTGSLRGDIEATYRGVIRFVNSPQGAAYLRTTIAECVRDPRIAELYSAAQKRASVGAYEMFARGEKRGEIQTGANTRWAVEWVGGIFASFTVTGTPLPHEDDVAGMVDFVLHGVGA